MSLGLILRHFYYLVINYTSCDKPSFYLRQGLILFRRITVLRRRIRVPRLNAGRCFSPNTKMVMDQITFKEQR